MFPSIALQSNLLHETGTKNHVPAQKCHVCGYANPVFVISAMPAHFFQNGLLCTSSFLACWKSPGCQCPVDAHSAPLPVFSAVIPTRAPQ